MFRDDFEFHTRNGGSGTSAITSLFSVVPLPKQFSPGPLTCIHFQKNKKALNWTAPPPLLTRQASKYWLLVFPLKSPQNGLTRNPSNHIHYFSDKNSARFLSLHLIIFPELFNNLYQSGLDHRSRTTRGFCVTRGLVPGFDLRWLWVQESIVLLRLGNQSVWHCGMEEGCEEGEASSRGNL